MLLECPRKCTQKPKFSKFGYFYRTSDSKRIQRWKCLNCKKTFSSATSNACFGQKKRRLNPIVKKLVLAKASQRRIAKLLKINRKTVARKIEFLALQSKKSRFKFLHSLRSQKVQDLQFDDMVSFEHTKCKPLAISLLVEEGSRKVLDFEVSEMSAGGKLAAISRARYGVRRDGRKEAWLRLFKRSRQFVCSTAHFKSDEHPLYPKVLSKHFPKAIHERFKGRRGCVVGQGELKAGGFDPLFSLNHTCAMIRDSVGRLVRRTWCTTKKLENLRDHIEIYVDYHNSQLT